MGEKGKYDCVAPIPNLRHHSAALREALHSAMAKRLIPLLDRVLVEKIVAPTKSVGGILLPESAVSKVRAKARATIQRFDTFSNERCCIMPPVDVTDLLIPPPK